MSGGTLSFPQVRWLVYIGVLVLPFTALRFGLVGAGEILLGLALSLFLVLTRGSIRISDRVAPLLTFWSGYLLLIAGGFFYVIIILNNTIDYAAASFDFASYLTVLFVLLLLADDRFYRGIAPAVFFKRVFTSWALIFLALYFLSLRFPQIFGLQLRYYQFFAPLVENVHQTAMLICAMPFVLWNLALKERSIFRKIFYVTAGALFCMMAVETGSTKAGVAVLVGTLVSAFFLLWTNVARSRSMKVVSVLVVALVLTSLVVGYSDRAAQLALAFFYENDGSAARENLYGLGLQKGMESFLFGHGPGPHIGYSGYESFSDAHNTLLTLFLQGGVFAVILFLYCWMRLLARNEWGYFSLGALAAVSIYFIGGDILRRLPIWILIVGVVYSSGRARHGGRQASSFASSG